MAKTVKEINEKVARGQAVVFTAEEIIDVVEQVGLKKAAEEVDVVTTGTFGPMCSSGIYLNTGHSKPRIKMGGGKAWLNDDGTYDIITNIGVTYDHTDAATVETMLGVVVP